MQKIIVSLALITSLFIIMSCSGETKETKKEVVIVPAKPPVIIKETVKKPTTIVLDKNGVKVEAKKVDVTIKNR
ncbi:MAG TPA: hypothetical protein VJ111_10845 [Chitinophagaceae bacterium]|nr:hypothetical protein [Chitinophagaceae bacterium]